MEDFEEQIFSMFSQDDMSDNTLINNNESAYSDNAYEYFEEEKINFSYFKPYIHSAYHELLKIVPGEIVSFNSFDTVTALYCELLSSALCHQINWDYLRKEIKSKVEQDKEWISIEHLQSITPKEINSLLSDYDKPERIDAQGRATIIRQLASDYNDTPRGFLNIFYNDNFEPRNYESIREQLLKSSVFSADPIEKKLQLLMLKISIYKGFSDLSKYCKPTIDYHLIRSFLRRGWVYPVNKHGREFVFSDTFRKERSMAALRKHCSSVVECISKISDVPIGALSVIEWTFGRSVCVEIKPDCELKTDSSVWLIKAFNKCPFYDLCLFKQRQQYKQTVLFQDQNLADSENEAFNIIDAPKYIGNSY